MGETPPRTLVCHVADRVEGAVYIGRAVPSHNLQRSIFANPFKISPDPRYRCTRAQAVDKYQARIEHDILEGRPSKILANLPSLRGKYLACWCRHLEEQPSPENRCHADVLIHFLETYSDEELEQLGAGSHDLV